jgi:hypothetical protein
LRKAAIERPPAKSGDPAVSVNRPATNNPVLTSQDFFSTSGCRDLLFHVQEHRVTSTEVGLFVQENDLTFIGFEMARDLRTAYESRSQMILLASTLSNGRYLKAKTHQHFSGCTAFGFKSNDQAVAQMGSL